MNDSLDNTIPFTPPTAKELVEDFQNETLHRKNIKIFDQDENI